MNISGEITGKWGDGAYAFRLSVMGILELEQKCDAPFAVIFNRVNDGTFKLNDVRETIRLGLIGGGLPPTKALELVDRYALPLIESLPITRAILAAVMFGFDEAPLGEAEAAPGKATSASTPQPSSGPDASLASVLASFDQLASGNTMPL